MVHKPRDSSREKETLSLVYLQTSDSGKAILVKQVEGNAEWLPVSQIEFDEDLAEEGKVLEVTLPRWLKEEKGFV